MSQGYLHIMADHAGGRRSARRTKVSKFISMNPNSNLNHFQQLLFHTIPPPLDQYDLYWSYSGLTRHRRGRRDRPYSTFSWYVLYGYLLSYV